MNKYLIRGLFFLLIGVVLCYYGIYAKNPVASFYKIPLIVGVISFGYGFILIIYRFIRKIERKSIMEERAEESKEHERPST